VCLIVVAIEKHPLYPLVLVANRDEFYSRPTAPLHAWPQAPLLRAGQDLEYGGTWAGWHADGRMALLTNVRRPDARHTGHRSRGEIPLRYLLGEHAPEDFALQLRAGRGEYAPFNLLFGTAAQLYYLSSDDPSPCPLAAGVHGLSNAALNTPWPKVEHARQGIEELLATSLPLSPQRLFATLERTEPFPDRQLPETGVGIAWERVLSPPFIVSPSYGTRSTTLLLVDRCGGATLIERRYREQGGPQWYHQRTFVAPPGS